MTKVCSFFLAMVSGTCFSLNVSCVPESYLFSKNPKTGHQFLVGILISLIFKASLWFPQIGEAALQFPLCVQVRQWDFRALWCHNHCPPENKLLSPRLLLYFFFLSLCTFACGQSESTMIFRYFTKEKYYFEKEWTILPKSDPYPACS